VNYKELTTLAVEGTRIIIKDAMTMLYEDALIPEWPHVVVPPGEYVVSIKTDDGEVKGVRVCLANIEDPKRGTQVEDVSVDHGAVAICDYDALLAAAKSDPQGYSDWTEEECEETIWEKDSGVLEFGDVSIAHLKTVIGDGSFPVFELLDGARVVGMECDFE
jgi:hypothetical protein